MVGWFPKTGDENITWLFCFGGGAFFNYTLTSSYYIDIPILYLIYRFGYAVKDAVDWF